jgi:hypothetical protein
MTVNQRYFVRHHERGWCIHDVNENKQVFYAEQKSLVIAESQRLNGFTPIDGNESTYSDQTREHCK